MSIHPSKPLGLPDTRRLRVRPHYDSDLEKRVCGLLRRLFPDLVLHSRALIPPLEIDAYSPKNRLAFEVNGDYYHSTGHLYRTIRKSAKEYHEHKRREVEATGGRLAFIWENDWRCHREEVVMALTDLCLLNKMSPILEKVEGPLDAFDGKPSVASHKVLLPSIQARLEEHVPLVETQICLEIVQKFMVKREHFGQHGVFLGGKHADRLGVSLDLMRNAVNWAWASGVFLTPTDVFDERAFWVYLYPDYLEQQDHLAPFDPSELLLAPEDEWGWDVDQWEWFKRWVASHRSPLA